MAASVGEALILNKSFRDTAVPHGVLYAGHHLLGGGCGGVAVGAQREVRPAATRCSRRWAFRAGLAVQRHVGHAGIVLASVWKDTGYYA